MLVDEVTQRLAAAGAVDRVEGALELNAMIESGSLPAAAVSAFVVPMGVTGGEVRNATVPFIQDLLESVAVIIAVRTAQPGGGHARGTLAEKIDAVIAVLAGWQPVGAVDTLRLARGYLVSLRKGVALYQLEFTIASQLRIIP